MDYRVGQSNWKTDWPGSQEVKQPYKITFSLDSVRGTYTLKIGTLIDRPLVPVLQIDVNGHTGLFFLHPKLSYSRSDFTFAFDPHESQSTVTADIPASLLKQGENTITITCVDEPSSPGNNDRFSGLSYDALSLNQDPAPRPNRASRRKRSRRSSISRPATDWRRSWMRLLPPIGLCGPGPPN